jgi:hypothetical protein
MNDNEIISYTALERWLESTGDEGEFKRCAELLIHAIQNWPKEGMTEPADFLEELKRAVGKPLTLANINTYLNALDFRTAGDSGRMESVALLLDMFDAHLADPAITLDAMLHKLTQHCTAAG